MIPGRPNIPAIRAETGFNGIVNPNGLPIMFMTRIAIPPIIALITSLTTTLSGSSKVLPRSNMIRTPTIQASTISILSIPNYIPFYNKTTNGYLLPGLFSLSAWDSRFSETRKAYALLIYIQIDSKKFE